MSQREPDELILLDMRVEIDLFRAGRSFLPALVTALDLGLESLACCRKELARAMRAEWDVLQEVSKLAFRAGRLMPLVEHRPALDEALGVFECLLETAIAEAIMSPYPR